MYSLLLHYVFLMSKRMKLRCFWSGLICRKKPGKEFCWGNRWRVLKMYSDVIPTDKYVLSHINIQRYREKGCWLAQNVVRENNACCCWSWYCLSHPAVSRKLMGSIMPTPSRYASCSSAWVRRLSIRHSVLRQRIYYWWFIKETQMKMILGWVVCVCRT